MGTITLAKIMLISSMISGGAPISDIELELGRELTTAEIEIINDPEATKALMEFVSKDTYHLERGFCVTQVAK